MLFKNVLVDENLKRQLISLVKNNRISHAQLFLGQEGSHVFALAVAYAQYICCENPKEDDSCGVCPSCVKFSKLSHPDFHLIFPNCITKNVKKDPDSNQFAQEFKDFVFRKSYHISLEEWLKELGGENKQASINIRDCSNIINQNNIRSFEGGYKIYLVWMVERLYHAAAPKLLKTLEEPENKTLFILISENSDKILATILSRTQLIKIPPVSEENVKKQLMAEYNSPEEVAEDIAAISEGNYIRAVDLFLEKGELDLMLNYFELMFRSMIDYSRTPNNYAQIKFLEVQSMFSEIISKGRESQKFFISFILRMVRNILMMHANNDVLVKATETESRLIAYFKSFITLKNAYFILNECNLAIYHIERNGNSALIFSDLYLKIAQHLAPSN